MKDKKIIVQQGKRVERKPNEFPQDLVVAGRRSGMFDEFARYNYKPRMGDVNELGQIKGHRLEEIMRELADRKNKHDRANMLEVRDQQGIDMDMLSRISQLSQGHYDMGRRVPVNPNSPDGIQELINNALAHGLQFPFVLCMTQRTWSEFIDTDAKEFIVQQMDDGALEVSIDSQAPDKAIYLKEKEE